MTESNYRCFLYKQVDGKTVSNIFSADNETSLTEVVDRALADGWHTTFADFVDEIENITEDQKHAMKDVCSVAAGDYNILANADQIKDIDKLREAYERVMDKPIDKRVKTINGVRNVIRKALGESHVNQ